jgi:hypothetical protein
MSKYWEVTGAVRDKIFQLSERRVKAHKAMLDFAKKCGTKDYATCESFGVSFVLMFDSPPDLKVWKARRGSPKCYEPKLSTKTGNILYKQMREIAAYCPSGTDVNKAIGFENWFTGIIWKTAGYCIVGKRIFITADVSYSPPKELTNCIKRISDTVYERLSQEKRKS